MNRIKKILGLGLAMSIFMMHIVFLFHSINHHAKDYAVSKTVQIQKLPNVSLQIVVEKCTICDLFLQSQVAFFSLFTAIVLALGFSSAIYFRFKPYHLSLLYYRKTRAPPYGVVVTF